MGIDEMLTVNGIPEEEFCLECVEKRNRIERMKAQLIILRSRLANIEDVNNMLENELAAGGKNYYG